MWIEGILIGIIIGLMRGGRLNYLSNLELKHGYIFILGVLIQISPFFLGKFAFFATKANIISFVGYALIFIFLLLNISQKGVKIICLGSLMNLLVLALNKFKMPIKADGTNAGIVKLRLAIEAGEIKNYFLFSTYDNYSFYLGKIIQMPDFYIGVPVISISDILIGIGMIILVQWTMVSKKGFFV